MEANLVGLENGTHSLTPACTTPVCAGAYRTPNRHQLDPESMLVLMPLWPSSDLCLVDGARALGCRLPLRFSLGWGFKLPHWWPAHLTHPGQKSCLPLATPPHAGPFPSASVGVAPVTAKD